MEDANFVQFILTALSIVGGFIAISRYLGEVIERGKSEAAQLTRIETIMENVTETISEVKDTVGDTNNRLDELEREMRKSKEWRDQNSRKLEALVQFKVEQRRLNKETAHILENYKKLLEDTNARVAELIKTN